MLYTSIKLYNESNQENIRNKNINETQILNKSEILLNEKKEIYTTLLSKNDEDDDTEIEFNWIDILDENEKSTDLDNDFLQNQLKKGYNLKVQNIQNFLSSNNTKENRNLYIVTNRKIAEKNLSKIIDKRIEVLIYCGSESKIESLLKYNEDLYEEIVMITTEPMGVLEFFSLYGKGCALCSKSLESEEEKFKNCIDHKYHKECIKYWKILGKGNNCPLCKKDFAIFDDDI